MIENGRSCKRHVRPGWKKYSSPYLCITLVAWVLLTISIGITYKNLQNKDLLNMNLDPQIGTISHVENWKVGSLRPFVRQNDLITASLDGYLIENSTYGFYMIHNTSEAHDVRSKTVLDILASQISIRKIFTFWNSGELTIPAHLQLALETVELQNPSIPIYLVDDAIMIELFPDTPLGYFNLSLNHRSDYARCRLLKAFGGMYIDLDTIAIRSWDSLFQRVVSGQYDLVKYSWLSDGDSFGCSFMGPMRPSLYGLNQCQSLWETYFSQGVVFEGKGADNLLWGISGPTIRDPIENYWHNHPEALERVYNVEGRPRYMLAEFIFAEDDQDFLRNVTEYFKSEKRDDMGMLIAFWNSALPACLKTKDRDEILCSDTAYGTLMRTLLRSANDCIGVQVDESCEY